MLKNGFALLCLIALGSAGQLSAQSIFGELIGSVKDSSGALVAKAKVTITNDDENTSHSVQTNNNGDYEALNLKPGHYSVTVVQAGFEESTKREIALDARQTSRVDFVLRVGSQKQSVSVEGTAGVIASETDAIASSYGTEKITTLPANFRASTSTTPYPLLTTLPGVQSDSGGDTYLSIQGGMPNQSELSIDGISAQSVRQNRPLIEIFPSVEAIAEIKVQGVGNSTEYGSAGDITTISKSGTNTYHGSAVWNYQNADFDATPFGSTNKPQKQVNNYAFSAGGPVLIPHVYKGKDKTFFFADYEGLMYPRTSTFQDYVPTVAMKNGDFSHESGTITDPTTGKPFPGNIIPASRISSIAQKIQQGFYPDPNNGSLTVSHANNWNANKPTDIQSKQFDIRGDHYFSSTQSVFARFSLKNATSLGANDILQPSTNNTQQNRSLVASYNYTIRPNLQNEFRAGYTTDSPGSTSSFDGKSFQQSLGFIGLPTTPFNGITGISFNNFSGLGVGRLDGTELYRTFVINDNVTWTRGAHTVKTGLDLRFMRSKTTLGFVGSDNYGNANFTGTFTGSEYADFLLGAPHDTSYGDVQHDNDGYSKRYQAYLQDTWRFSQKLTLEYGVRWDFNPPFHDQYGYIGNFDPSVPKTGRVIYPDGYGSLLAPGFLADVNACPGTPNLLSSGPGIPGVPCTPFVTNSQAGLGNGLRQSHKFNFFPRLGFAYRPGSDGKTVVRGGFGIYDAPLLGAVLYSLTGTAQTDVRTFQNVGANGLPLFYWPTHTPAEAAFPPLVMARLTSAPRTRSI
jgi:Carboxypeptidase regulatory-like domain